MAIETTDLFTDNSARAEDLDGHDNNEDKYASWTAEQLIKKAREADKHIATLIQEKRQTTNDFLATVTELREEIKSIASKVTPKDQDPDPSKGATELDPKNLDKLISDALTSKLAEQKQRENAAMIAAKAREVYGESFGQKLSQIAESLGLSREEAGALAATKPIAFMELFKLNQLSQAAPIGTTSRPRDNVTSTRPFGSTATEAIPGLPESERYSNLKKLPFEKFYSPEVQEIVRKHHMAHRDKYLKT